MYTKQCQQCNLIFANEDKRVRFCSRSCSATFNNTGRKHTTEARRKIAAAATPERMRELSSLGIYYQRQRKEENMIAYALSPKTCNACGAMVPYERRDRKSCSSACSKLLVGGLRKGAGQSKHGWYQGLWCDSLYELAFVAYHLDHGSVVERNTVIYRYRDEVGKERAYLPDFRVDGKLYEIKGWMSERSRLKAGSVNEPLTMIIGEEQNRPFIDYVKNKHGIRYERFIELYDDSDYVAEFICQSCGQTFFRDKRKRAFACSQKCSGALAQRRRLGAPERFELSFP